MEDNLKVYKSDKFAVENTASLSLFIYPDSLIVFAKDQNEANLAIHYYTDFSLVNLDKLLQQDPLLRLQIGAKIYFHTDKFSLIPSVLFSPGQERVYLEFAGELPEKVHFFSSPLDGNNLQLVSFVPENIQKSLKQRFSDLNFYHGATSFLSYLFKERFNLTGQEILVLYFKTGVYLAAFTEQDLSLFNRFEVADREELLKYIFITMEQLNYDSNHLKVSVFGVTDQSQITEDWGKMYFHNFTLIRPHSNQNYSQGFKHLKSENLFEINWQFQ